MGDFIQTRREGHVLIVTLDRPAVLNALHAPACHELSAVWDGFATDDDLWIAVVTGAGRAFCAGHDLIDGFHDPMPESGWAGLSHRKGLTKPMIAAVNGLAFGGGWEIAMACDIIVADPAASFALPEPKVGFAALGGGANRLPLRMPWHIAMDYALTGRRMDAATAERWGLVSTLSEPGRCLEAALDRAAQILACSPLAIRATKAVAQAAFEPDARADELYALSARLAHGLAALDDTREGLAAFAEKRPPVWAGH